MTSPEAALGRILFTAAAAFLLPASALAQRTDTGPESGSPIEIACAPQIATGQDTSALAVIGSQDGTTRAYYGPFDTLVISGGRADGIDAGQEFFVRRLVPVAHSTDGPTSVLHTAGWVTITATERKTSLAAVSGVSDRLQRGDMLQPFRWPDAVTVAEPGAPDYDHPGTIISGLDGRSLVAENDYVILNLGSTDGILPGQRFTVFRHTVGGVRAVTALGEAVAVLVEEASTTARMTSLRDIVEIGDLAAPQR